ncbi:MAG: hypothetical protein JNN11_01235 [Candidatus Doudnabacteria bacterium]|nr:hypothetical protein [Candidatus Doudnabacteria bacterium]
MQIQDLKQALEDGDIEKAKSVLQVFLSSDVSEKEAGKILLDLTMLHVQSENTFNKIELAFLDEAIEELKALKKVAANAGEALEQAELKSRIQNS